MDQSWWDDFSNNLATDLAPLISLFGEQPTKQYLSECLTVTDLVIFSMAPLGIITTIVSTIRVCGTSSFRALIGRAQEGAGSAEAELCSSTSRDVCELYNNGGIARVFGRPLLLEFVLDSNPNIEDFFPVGPNIRTAGIYTFEGYVNKDNQEWKEQGKHSAYRRERSPDYEMGSTKSLRVAYHTENNKRNETERFAPNPNLSLNVGIKARHQLWFYAAAVFGTMLQSCVLIWAASAKFILKLERGDVQDQYAVPMFVLGTVLLCSGVGLCSYMIERCTEERTFHRDQDSCCSQLYWIQPGNQLIGDQAFDSFIYTHPKGSLMKYTTSWKANKPPSTLRVTTGVTLTLVGFVFQFLGLRACHSSVAVVQLGVTMLMSLVRALLRTERLSKEDNLASFDSGELNVYEGHELGWLSLYMSTQEKECSWYICYDRYHGGIQHSSDRIPAEGDVPEAEVLLYRKSEAGGNGRHLMAGFIHHEGTSLGSRETILQRWLQSQIEEKDLGNLHNSSKAWHYGMRLVSLTNSWEEKYVVGRDIARSLAQAIEATTAELYTADTDFEGDWANVSTISWTVPCMIISSGGGPEEQHISLSVKRAVREDGKLLGRWLLDRSELESLLNLWLWSFQKLKHGNHSLSHGDESYSPATSFSRILPGEQDEYNDMDDWGAAKSSVKREITLDFSGEGQSTPLWCQDIGHFRIRRPQDFPVHQYHFFGLQNIMTRKEKTTSWVHELSTTSSTGFLCGQQIYSLFFQSMTTAIKSIGGQTEIDQNRRDFRISNSNITRIRDSFVDSGLGSPEEALQCIIPVLALQNKLPRSAEQKLRWAARGGHTDVVKELIDAEGIELDAKDRKGRTALWWAASWGRADIVDMLLRKGGVDVMVRETKHGRVPIHEAAEHGHVEVVRRLLQDERVDADDKDKYKETGLMWARLNGHNEVAELLKEHLKNRDRIEHEHIDSDWWREDWAQNGYQSRCFMPPETSPGHR